MSELLTASPSVGSYRCGPMSVAEIDGHPDADRIWATIVHLRKIADDAAEAAIAEADSDAADDLDDAVDAERRNIGDRLLGVLSGSDAEIVAKVKRLAESLA